MKARLDKWKEMTPSTNSSPTNPTADIPNTYIQNLTTLFRPGCEPPTIEHLHTITNSTNEASINNIGSKLTSILHNQFRSNRARYGNPMHIKCSKDVEVPTRDTAGKDEQMITPIIPMSTNKENVGSRPTLRLEESGDRSGEQLGTTFRKEGRKALKMIDLNSKNPTMVQKGKQKQKRQEFLDLYARDWETLERNSCVNTKCIDAFITLLIKVINTQNLPLSVSVCATGIYQSLETRGWRDTRYFVRPYSTGTQWRSRYLETLDADVLVIPLLLESDAKNSKANKDKNRKMDNKEYEDKYLNHWELLTRIRGQSGDSFRFYDSMNSMNASRNLTRVKRTIERTPITQNSQTEPYFMCPPNRI